MIRLNGFMYLTLDYMHLNLNWKNMFELDRVPYNSGACREGTKEFDKWSIIKIDLHIEMYISKNKYIPGPFLSNLLTVRNPMFIHFSMCMGYYRSTAFERQLVKKAYDYIRNNKQEYRERMDKWQLPIQIKH